MSLVGWANQQGDWIRTIIGEVVAPRGPLTSGRVTKIAIDNSSNVLLVAPARRPLDFGKGPIGPGDKDAVLASIDRDGTVRGLLPIAGRSRSSVAADASGVFLAVSLDADATIGGQTIEVPSKSAVAALRLSSLPPP